MLPCPIPNPEEVSPTPAPCTPELRALNLQFLEGALSGDFCLSHGILLCQLQFTPVQYPALPLANLLVYSELWLPTQPICIGPKSPPMEIHVLIPSHFFRNKFIIYSSTQAVSDFQLGSPLLQQNPCLLSRPLPRSALVIVPFYYLYTKPY